MKKRRTVVATIGAIGTIGIAGCSSISDLEVEEESEENNQEPTEEQEEEEESEFILSDFSLEEETVEQGKNIEFSVKIENGGNIENTKEITTKFADEIVDTEEYTIKPSDKKAHSHSIDTTDVEIEEYILVVSSEDDKITTSVEVIMSLEENMETMRLTLDVFGLNLVDWSKEEEELHIEYETTATSGSEIREDMMSVEEAYLAARRRGLETERIVAEMAEPGDEPVGRYTIENEWSNQLTEGTITESEMQEKIIDTLEYT